ncbi:flagellin FliC [Myxococcota bacterium]|nr:flagellin FliC [Myxococcota bacterium]MBU1379269.1 flagellin FliC [Myxococcota bacterium]MBU1499005.1 flagellin FliC [Myxococcota bacterium]
MSLSIRTNLSSMNAQRTLAKTQGSLKENLSKLASGYRVRSAADDAAGLAISEKMKAQIRSLQQAERNANDGISLIQTADGALNELHGIMDRLRELGIQSANGTYTDSDRVFINNEVKEMINEVNRIVDVTEFNSHKLLNGSKNSGISFQVGINNSPTDVIKVSILDMHASRLGASASTYLDAISVSTVSKALQAIDVVDGAISTISSQRSKLGASQNRLQVTVSNLASYRENLSSANSQIRDVDVASETADMAKNNILMQAGTSVLAQANQIQQVALNLIG